MITIPDLQTALLDLLYELQGTDVKLIIGGGYGIYLKSDYVRHLGVRTLLHTWPEARSLDIYTILATTTGKEWVYALQLRDQHDSHPCVREAGRLVAKFFSSLDCLGMIRLRESPYYRRELQLDEFMSALREVFPARGDS